LFHRSPFGVRAAKRFRIAHPEDRLDDVLLLFNAHARLKENFGRLCFKHEVGERLSGYVARIDQTPDCSVRRPDLRSFAGVMLRTPSGAMITNRAADADAARSIEMFSALCA
jgi:hypothetical protein